MRVQVFHLDHAYSQGHSVLKNVSLDLKPGSLNFLIGPSGSGKSTLMRLLFGEEIVQTGQILVGDWSLAHLNEQSRPAYRRQVGYVYQDLRLLLPWSAEENVMLPLEAAGHSAREQRIRAHELLHQVGLGHHIRTPVAQLSGGERQRVAIARAMIHRPQFLLADEPTANLDPQLSQGMLKLLHDQRLRGVTLLISTHDYSLLNHYRGEVFEMTRGQISRHVQSGRGFASLHQSREDLGP